MKYRLPDSAGLHSPRDGHGLVEVFGEDSCCQTIIGVVGSLDHFFNCLKLHNLLNWPKYL